MTLAPTEFDPFADPGPPPVGAYVAGSPSSPRQVVRWLDQFRDAHELADGFDPDTEAYLSMYHYPQAAYGPHFLRAGQSPRGYAGAAGCQFLMFDIDRAGELDTALADARKLARFLMGRYGPLLEDGLAVYYSGAKGFHLLLELAPGIITTATVPATCRRLALMLAAAAGTRIDTGCFDHQRLVRLPNSRHPSTGLHKRFLTLEELHNLDLASIRELARHPAGFAGPACGEFLQALQDDWDIATMPPTPPRNSTVASGGHPVVPKFVLDFIGFADVQDPGRAVTLFRCAAALSQAGTPAPVVAGLLQEPALKTGLDLREVEKQLRDGIAHGRRESGAA